MNATDPRFRLEAGEVALFSVSLVREEAAQARLLSTLSDAERRRAERFLVEAPRSRFIVARATLRRLLGRFLGVAPGALELQEGPKGKPALAPRHGRDLRFNVSHSGDRALIAFALGREVGVDLERVERTTDLLAIARRFFSERELECLLGVAKRGRPRAFFEIWTRKEAYVKAKGGGLSIPLASFDVSAGEPPRLLRVEDDPDEAARWTLFSLEPAPGYVGAVAASGPCRLRTISAETLD
jgi:4'-phosphopantetheinyl transferase